MNYFDRKAFKRKQKKVFKKWKKDRGDQTLRLDYDLNQESVVLDVGGFKGQWASDLYSKYNSKFYIFEPVKDFFNQINQRFSKNDSVEVFDFGLGGRTRKESISITGDASSIFQDSVDSEQINIVNISEWLVSYKINQIDLIKLNIEGGEYELLEHIISTGLILNIKEIQVQFHHIEDNSEDRMSSIQDKLIVTHQPTYQYHFIWENWRIRE